MPQNATQQKTDRSAERGIRNVRTEERFEARQNKRTLQQELIRKRGGQNKNNTGGIQPMGRVVYGNFARQNRERIYADTAKEFSTPEFEITKQDIDLAVEGRPEKPPFPYGIFLVAFIKDILDLVFTVSIVGIIVVLPLSFFMAFILFFWLQGKMSGGWYKKKIIKWLWKRFFLTIGLEAIPFLGLIPATTIFVYMAHNKESKLVQHFDNLLEAIHRKGIPLKK
jgi:hypothetical protein